jgi:signal transduction histidine kinase
MDYAGQNMEKGGDSMVYVRISDTGKGVSSKIMAKLFQNLSQILILKLVRLLY